MSRIQPQQYQSEYPQSSSIYPSSNPHPQRKNFKHAIRERKQEISMSMQEENSIISIDEKGNHKNFKHQIQRKKSIQKRSKENRKNFYKLEDSIINELYSHSAGKLESGSYHEIEIQHQTFQGERHPQPFFLPKDQKSIEITEQNGQLLSRERRSKEQKSADYKKISQSIKKTFEQRSPKRSPQKRSQQKNSFSKLNLEFSQQYDEEISLHDNIRPNFKNLQSFQNTNKKLQTKLDRKEDDRQSNKSFRSSQASMTNRFNHHRQRSGHSLYRQKSGFKETRQRENSMQRQAIRQRELSQQRDTPRKRNVSFSRQKQTSKQSKIRGNSGRQYSSKAESLQSYDDSLNEIIPAFQIGQPEISDLNFDSNNQSVNELTPQQLRDSTHELSFISRFSMTSEEGGIIKRHLEREINENEFGPYQNALSNFAYLIDEYPHAWPIFRVGSKILEDRKQYEERSEKQEQEMSKKLGQIKMLKEKQRKMISDKRPKSEINCYRILRLVRELGKQLE